MKSHPRRHALTRTEVLIVAAIVGLLVAVVVPGLAAAQKRARSVACADILAAFGQALAMYVDDNTGHIPGVNTSGVELRAMRPTLGNINQRHLPVQSWDWMSPLMPYLVDELLVQRVRRWHRLWTDFRCPANLHMNDSVFGTGSVPDGDRFANYDWPAASYLMPAHFQMWGTDQAGTVLSSENDDFLITARALPSSWDITNTSFASRLSEVGPAHAKIFAADGTRFVGFEGHIDFDAITDPALYGGFGSTGAWFPASTAYGVAAGTENLDGDIVTQSSISDGLDLPVSCRLGAHLGRRDPFPGQTEATEHSSRVPNPRDLTSLRHMNALFFDGHVELLTIDQSREISYWYPTGSVVTGNRIGMTTVPPNFVIP